jgi:hypothetical protein
LTAHQKKGFGTTQSHRLAIKAENQRRKKSKNPSVGTGNGNGTGTGIYEERRQVYNFFLLGK